FRLAKLSNSPDDGSEATANIAAALRGTSADHPLRAERLKLWDEAVEFLSNSDMGFDIRGKTTNAEIVALKKEIAYWASEGDSANQAELLKDLYAMYHSRYRSSNTTSEAILAKAALMEAIELTPEEDEETLALRLRTVAFLCSELYRNSFDPKYL